MHFFALWGIGRSEMGPKVAINDWLLQESQFLFTYMLMFGNFKNEQKKLFFAERKNIY